MSLELMASVGLCSVVSYGVAQRTNEFGIRIALGAQQRHVLRLVFRSAVGSIGSGVRVSKSRTCQLALYDKHLGLACCGVAEGFGAGWAGADGAEMLVAVNAGGVAVGKGELDGVVAYGVGGFGAGFGFEHG